MKHAKGTNLKYISVSQLVAVQWIHFWTLCFHRPGWSPWPGLRGWVARCTWKSRPEPFSDGHFGHQARWPHSPPLVGEIYSLPIRAELSPINFCQVRLIDFTQDHSLSGPILPRQLHIWGCLTIQCTVYHWRQLSCWKVIGIKWSGLLKHNLAFSAAFYARTLHNGRTSG